MTNPFERRVQQEVQRSDLNAIQKIFNLFASDDLTQKIKHIQVPLEIMVGTKDPRFLHQAQLIAKSGIPIEFIPGVTHEFVFFEAEYWALKILRKLNLV